MTAMPLTLDRIDTAVAPDGAVGAGRGAAKVRPVGPSVRPGRREGRGTGPQARPARPLRAPRTVGRVGGRSCAPEVSVATPSATTWRLTDRGIAVVMVTGMMIMVAALAVIGLTALRVTGDGYVAQGQSQLSTR